MRVRHPGVHALAAGRRVDVRGVAGEHYPPAPVAGGRPEVTPEGGQPSRIADLHGSRRTFRDQLLYLLECRRLAAAVARIGPDPAPPLAAHGYADQGQSVRAEEEVNRVAAPGPVQCDNGQHAV